MLNASEVEAFRRDGLVIPSWRVSPDQLADLRAALERVVAGNTHVRPEQLISVHISKGGGEKTVGDEAFLTFAHNTALLDMIEQVVGPDIILWGCQLFCKPGGDGMEVPWHQDGRYWPIRPLATCTAWIALDDSMPENGCMRFIPGSHSGRMYRHRKDDRADLALDLVLEDGEADMASARDVCLKAGQLSLHDVYLVHGSAPNRSPKRRAGLAIRYMPATSLFDRTMFETRTTPNGLTVDFAQRPLWLVRGKDRTGKNDFAIGRA